jgi:hypothetical protein
MYNEGFVLYFLIAGAGRLARRRSTLDDIQKKVAIVIKSVDRSCNNKEFLRKYFQKYGVVKRVFANPGKESASIHFDTHVRFFIFDPVI